jgi:cell division protein FtsB
MNDLDLKDEIATSERHDKRLRTVRMLFVTLLVVILPFGFIAYAAVANDTSQTKSQTSEEQPYKFAALGKECSSAITSYDNKLAANGQATKEISDKAATDAQSLKNQTSDYQASQDAAYKKAFNDYTTLWKAGNITTDDYMAKIGALKPVADNIVDSSGINAQGESELAQTTILLLQQKQTELKDLTDKRNQLVGCVNAANSKQDFSISDVSNFQAVIATSK